MKKMKKLASLVLALAMALTLAVPAMAAKTSSHTITIENETTGHIYEAYQVFVGDITGGKLTNIEWGTGVNGTALLTELKGLTAYADCKTPADVAGVLAGFGDDSTDLNAFAKIVAEHLTTSKATSSAGASANGKTSYSISVTGDGYYFVKDKDGSITGEGVDSYTKYILKVVKDVTVAAKDGTVTFEKKVKDTNDSTGATSDWQDSADYDIGDEVPFKLTGTLPENFDRYVNYYYAFHDTEEAGLTFMPETVEVKVGENVISRGDYDLKVGSDCTDGCTFEVVFDDLKDIAEKYSITKTSKITVEYKSRLNENANIGSQGNLNGAQLEYSNNPNTEGRGKTPKDTVIVFTYKVVVNKTDENEKPLAGAEFTLEKFVANKEGTETYNDVNGNWGFISKVETESGTTFTFKGLDDGVYRLTETDTPDGYNTIEPVYFTVTADHDIVWDGVNRTVVLNSLTGNVTTGKITFTAMAGDEKDANANDILSTDVVNQSGATLPETGGMGTTLFYALGAVLVIGAGVAMVTKKRMG